MRPDRQSGFTLVEMIVVIVITGILGSIAAVFIKLPVQQYMDVARRAELTDIANLALSRLESDIRSALPHSARRKPATCPSGTGTCDFLEFLPSSGSGRYRNGAGGTNDDLTIGVADISFEVLGAMPSPAPLGGRIIVMGNAGAAYAGNNLASLDSIAGQIVTFSAPVTFPLPSPSARFHVINKAVSYVCDPSVGGTLMRYSYDITVAVPIAQPTTAAELGTGRLLASNISSCSIDVTQSGSLVAISLGLSKDGEAATLYKVVHVSNEP